MITRIWDANMKPNYNMNEAGFLYFNKSCQSVQFLQSRKGYVKKILDFL